MTKFIGPEYLIGNAFIYLTDERFIGIRKINKYRAAIQQYWISNCRDALIYGEITSALYDFNDYFSFDRSAGVITLNPDVSVDALKQRFVDYLSGNIDKDFETVAKNLS